ncbi:hypothetical protein D1007_24305 [Hordeum vulgare]|nr:hypothetical protein D1007_24305 [Hordeum vulgare]
MAPTRESSTPTSDPAKRAKRATDFDTDAWKDALAATRRNNIIFYPRISEGLTQDKEGVVEIVSAMAEHTGSQRAKGKETTEELLARLTLREERKDDFVWEEELSGMVEQVKWLAIDRVHTPKISSPNVLYSDMRAS